ncbi:cysteine peptidase family C39 domain-containing protein [Spiroplasma endosymbiont of Agriotes lineatus]
MYIWQEQKNDCAVARLAMLIKYYHKQRIPLETLKQEASFQWEY